MTISKLQREQLHTNSRSADGHVVNFSPVPARSHSLPRCPARHQARWGLTTSSIS
jgi:hypothetical protein